MRAAAFALAVLLGGSVCAFGGDDLNDTVKEEKRAKLEVWRKALDSQNDSEVRKMLREKEKERHRLWVAERKTSEEVKESTRLLGKHPNKSRNKDRGPGRKTAASVK